MGLNDVYLWTNDTDVVVVLIAFMPDVLEINAGAQVIVLDTYK